MLKRFTDLKGKQKVVDLREFKKEQQDILEEFRAKNQEVVKEIEKNKVELKDIQEKNVVEYKKLIASAEIVKKEADELLKSVEEREHKLNNDRILFDSFKKEEVVALDKEKQRLSKLSEDLSVKEKAIHDALVQLEAKQQSVAVREASLKDKKDEIDAEFAKNVDILKEIQFQADKKRAYVAQVQQEHENLKETVKINDQKIELLNKIKHDIQVLLYKGKVASDDIIRIIKEK